jgi:hypothetical protein
VNFGLTPASSFTVVSDTSITATSPAGTAGIIDIRVTTPGGTSATSSNDKFTYYGPPTVTSVSPNTGSVNGSNTVTITGTDFLQATAVNFGLTPASSFTVESDTSITAITPAGVGLVNITVVTPAGTSPTSPNDDFTYWACFKEGSKILTDKGYKLVEQLKKGDLVKTLLDGYKPIVLIGKREIYHPASEERIKNQLYQYSSEKINELFEPLVITGCHSVLVDHFSSEEQREKVVETLGEIYVTNKKYRLPACVDERATVYSKEGVYTIYHLALEHENYYCNYGIYANGLLVESCSKRFLKELSNMELI